MVTNLPKNNAIVGRISKGGITIWGDTVKTWGDSIGHWGDPVLSVSNEAKHNAIITNKPKS